MSIPHMFTNERRRWLYHNNPVSRRCKIRSNKATHIKKMIWVWEQRIIRLQEKIKEYEEEWLKLAKEKD